MYQRDLSTTISKKLEQNPAVAILGARQVGKTTLAMEIAKNRPSIYLDLENEEDLQRLKNPRQYLELHADKLVIIDEVQRYPNLFKSLRGIIDARRRENRGNGRFLILGSASNELLQQSSESLAGRISYTELNGLTPNEIEKTDHKHLQKLWLRGGFPNSYIVKNNKASHEWRKDFIRTYIERDIPQLGTRIQATTLRRFWTMLAHVQGEPLNATKLANSLGVTSMTVGRYLKTMIDLLLVRKLQPWRGKTQKRLVKLPKTYIRDSGIVHTLLNIKDQESLLGNPILGKSWEGFVIQGIIATMPAHIQPYYYKTSAGAEIDLLLEINPKQYWAIEIKASTAPSIRKGFHTASTDIKAQRKYVIYTGEETYPTTNNTTITTLPDLIAELGKQA